MKVLINFACFAVLAVIITLLNVSDVTLGGIPTVIFTFVTYVAANVLCELQENKKKLSSCSH